MREASREELLARIAELESAHQAALDEKERLETLYKDASLEIDRKRELIVGYLAEIEHMIDAVDRSRAALLWTVKTLLEYSLISQGKAAELLDVPLIDLDEALKEADEIQRGDLK